MKWFFMILAIMLLAPDCFAETAKDAIRAMKRLDSRIDAGISYRDYPPLLGDVKFEVKEYLEDTDSKKNIELKGKIQESIELYEFANEIWAAKFSNEADSGLIFIDSNYFPYSEKVAKSFFSRFPECKKDLEEGGIMYKKAPGKMSVSLAVGKIWERAAVKLNEASVLLKSIK